MKRKILKTLLCLISIILFSFPACAKEYTSNKDGLDVMFAIDSSGSMSSNDPGHTGMSMVKAFIDTVHMENIRIGFVAYSDRIVSVSKPVSISDPASREALKNELNLIEYSGDTDMGLGVKTALESMPKEEGRERILIIISDGETDLPGKRERTEEMSLNDFTECANACRDEGIKVYGIAFEKYEGSADSLLNISSTTGGKSFKVSDPEDLINIFYSIFNDNFSMKIEEVLSGIYGSGEQTISFSPDEPYLDEMDILFISTGQINSASVTYGQSEIPFLVSGSYGVAKIDHNLADPSVNEIKLKANTSDGQRFKLFLISYRELTPVLNIEDKAGRNDAVMYEVYFKDRSGNIITDNDFYDTFSWKLDAKGNENIEISEYKVSDGTIRGTVIPKSSGSFELDGYLSDNLGSYAFEACINIMNTPPSGSLPELKVNFLSGADEIDLNNYFTDSDGDGLSYSIKDGNEKKAEISLDGSKLDITPLKGGRQTFTLLISDGEDTLSYPAEVRVRPLALSLWWLILIITVIIIFVAFKFFYKPKPEVEVIAVKKQGNHFAGKMDAYVTLQPDGTEDIPPLTFPMYKIKDTKVCLGDMMREYPNMVEALRLDLIYLIADEDRKIILYHTSPSTIMAGSSILCRHIQYSLRFGEVIYITAEDKAYEMELHYISVI